MNSIMNSTVNLAMPPLASTTVICRLCAGGRLATLPHVVSHISEFADISLPFELKAFQKHESPRFVFHQCAREMLSVPPPLRESKCIKRFKHSTKIAAKHGELEMLKWVVQVYLPGAKPYGTSSEAAKNGHLYVLEWLDSEYDDMINDDALSLAHEGHHAAVAEWYCKRWASAPRTRKHWQKYQMHRELMPQLSLPFLQWTIEQGWTFDDKVLVMAAKHSRMDVAKWLVGHLDQLYYKMMARHDRGDCSCPRVRPSSSAGSVELVSKCLNECVDGDICSYDTNWGRFRCDMCQRNYKWFPQDFHLFYVATGGDVEIIERVRASNFPWLELQSSVEVMDEATKSGQYDLVVWLHTHRSEGCTKNAMDLAAINGHLKVVQFLHKNRSEGCTKKAMDWAAFDGHLDVVKFLHENRRGGCTIDAMDEASRFGHLDVVKFLHKNRSEGCTDSASECAAYNGHLDVVKWLSAHYSDLFTTNVMDSAAEGGRLDVIEWLQQNRSERCSSSVLKILARDNKFEALRLLAVGRLKIEGKTEKQLEAMKCACGHQKPCG